MRQDICIRVGRRIRTLRDQRSWTQQHLSDHAALAREHLSELENGKKEIGIRTLERIAEALDVTLRDFFENI